MKKIFYLFLIMSLSIGSLTAQKPEKIYSFAKVDKPHEYYLQQVELWLKEIEKDQKNEDAWLNYYLANRNSYYSFREKGFGQEKHSDWKKESSFNKDLTEVRDLIQKIIPETFADYVTRDRSPFDNETFHYIEEAYRLRPNASEIFPLMITHYELNGDYTKKKEFNQKMYQTNAISSGLLNYGYNVLMTLKPNSIIITNGDNDTYPLWLLQDVYDLRKDVTVMILPMLSVPDYQKRMFNFVGIDYKNLLETNGSPLKKDTDIAEYILTHVNPNKHPIYVGLGARHTVKKFDENLYLVGLALEYSKTNFDNIAQIRNNFENKYALDYTLNRFEYDVSESVVNRMNANYFPGILKLYNYYKSAGDLDAAEKMKNMGMQIAERIDEGWVNYAKSVLK